MGLLSRMFGTNEANVEVDGLSGQATVVSLSEGGPYVNDRPTITMELDVELPGRERYSAQTRQVVGRLVIGRLQPGTTIPVRVHPKQDDPLETLQGLAELRDAGALTEEEFAAKKAEILQGL